MVICCQFGTVIPAGWKNNELVFNMVVGLPLFSGLKESK